MNKLTYLFQKLAKIRSNGDVPEGYFVGDCDKNLVNIGNQRLVQVGRHMKDYRWDISFGEPDISLLLACRRGGQRVCRQSALEIELWQLK